MRTHDVMDATGGAPTTPTTATLHLGQALRAADPGMLHVTGGSVSAGTLDGMLASIHVGDIGTLVAYRDDVVGEAVGCPS